MKRKSNVILLAAIMACAVSTAVMLRFHGAHGEFDSESLDLGQAPRNSIIERTIGFTNRGNSALEIRGLSSSCGCTAAVASSSILKPGGRSTLRITLHLGSYPGAVTHQLRAITNDPFHIVNVLTIKATGT